jgi:transcriptional regulator with XRE-family HTH domain
MTQKFRVEPCRCCGQDRQLVNGAWLREVRLASGVSLRQVAKRLNLTASYVSDMELGRRLCTKQIENFYDALDAGVRVA